MLPKGKFLFLISICFSIASSARKPSILEESEEEFVIVTESSVEEETLKPPLARSIDGDASAAVAVAAAAANPILERAPRAGGCDGAALPICTPGDALPICTPGARNTTVAPTNGTTALPRAFLRRLIQAGYRVVPPAKYGGPPDQAMGLPGVRSFGGMPQRFPAGYPQPWGPVAGAPAPAPYPPPPPFLPAAPFPPSFRQRPNVPQHPGFGGMPQRMPVPHHMMAPPAQMPMRGYPPPAPAIGYPQPHRFPPMMQYPPRQYRHLEQEYMQMKPRERKVAELPAHQDKGFFAFIK